MCLSYVHSVNLFNHQTFVIKLMDRLMTDTCLYFKIFANQVHCFFRLFKVKLQQECFITGLCSDAGLWCWRYLMGIHCNVKAVPSLNSLWRVVSFSKEVKPRLAKWPLVFNGRLVNCRLSSSVKDATGDTIRHQTPRLSLVDVIAFTCLMPIEPSVTNLIEFGFEII